MTTAQTILTDASARLVSADGVRTIAADQEGEMLRVLNRLVQSIYGLAGLPQLAGGFADTPFFVTRSNITLSSPATLWVSIPSSPPVVYLLGVRNAVDEPIHTVSRHNHMAGRIEFPPALIVQGRSIRSAGRPGDPAAGAIVTAEWSYAPPDMTDLGHFIGATTPSDSSTSEWPSHVGDQVLVDSVALYLAVKDNLTGAVQNLRAAIQQDSAPLAALLGLQGSALARAVTGA